MEAGASQQRVRVCGGQTKAAITRSNATRLDLSGYTGITAYDPGELVITLRAGTRLAEVEAVLAEKNQMLGFEPPDYARVLGTQTGRTTMGGVIASGFAGPRRPGAGNVRDHLLGFSAVSGRGEAFKAGGRVMKNVTGYDLAKLLCGSWGTLAVLTEVTLRVLPRAPFESTLLLEGLDDVSAVERMAQALATPFEPSAAAHLPGVNPVTALRLEGFGPSVVERLRQLQSALGAVGATRVIRDQESAQFWRGVRDLERFAGDARILWRLSLPASASAAVAAQIARAHPCECLYDWGGSLLWLALDAAKDATIGATSDAASAAAADAVRRAAEQAGGHALLMRAPDALRQRVPTFHPQSPGVAALSRRVKLSFDPHDVFGSAPLQADVAGTR